MLHNPAHKLLPNFKDTDECRFRLFCFPYAGGGASIFRLWKDFLPEHIQVCPVQLPGRENRITETPHSNLRELIQILHNGLQPFCTIPFAFFGHSMGALLAFELVREMRRNQSRLPDFLFMSARRAPHIPPKKPPVYHLPDREFIREIGEMNGTPEDVLKNEELMELLLPALRADFTLCETYQYYPEEPFDIPIRVFTGRHDADTAAEDMEAWKEQTRGGFLRLTVNGNHFFLQTHSEEILQTIKRDLAATAAC